MAPETLTTAGSTTVLTEVLRDRRRSLLLWSIALTAVTTMYVAFYPSVGADGSALDAYMDNMPAGLVEALGWGAIGSPGGYLSATVYGILGPALLLVFAIGAGARLIAGHEEDGTLELELTHPVSRKQVFTQRLLALCACVGVTVGVLTAVVIAMATAIDMRVGLNNIAAASTGLLLLVTGLSTVALAVGAATGRRSIALGTAAALAVLGYMANAIGSALDGGSWLTAVSPWSWYLGGDPLVNGWDVRGILLLAVVPITAAIVGMIAFDRRDLGT